MIVAGETGGTIIIACSGNIDLTQATGAYLVVQPPGSSSTSPGEPYAVTIGTASYTDPATEIVYAPFTYCTLVIAAGMFAIAGQWTHQLYAMYASGALHIGRRGFFTVLPSTVQTFP